MEKIENLNIEESKAFRLWFKAFMLLNRYNERYIEETGNEPRLTIEAPDGVIYSNNINGDILTNGIVSTNEPIELIIVRFQGTSETDIIPLIKQFEDMVRTVEIEESIVLNKTKKSLI